MMGLDSFILSKDLFICMDNSFYSHPVVLFLCMQKKKKSGRAHTSILPSIKMKIFFLNEEMRTETNFRSYLDVFSIQIFFRIDIIIAYKYEHKFGLFFTFFTNKNIQLRRIFRYKIMLSSFEFGSLK